MSILCAELLGAACLATVAICRGVPSPEMMLHHDYILYMNAIVGGMLLAILTTAASFWLLQIWKYRRCPFDTWNALAASHAQTVWLCFECVCLCDIAIVH